MKQDKRIVEKYFTGLGLISLEFSKQEMRNGQTPDFKVFSENNLVFYCEVKSIAKDECNEGLRNDPICEVKSIAKDECNEGLRNDPIYNNIQAKIHEAAKQFLSVNSNNNTLNVLAFVNYNNACDIIDLIAVVTGYFLSDSKRAYPIFRKYSDGRIKEEKNVIDLYLWFEKGLMKLCFREVTGERFEKLCQLLGVNKDSVRNLSDLYECFV